MRWISLSARCWCSRVSLWALCSWSSRSAVVVAAVMFARTGTVLINSPTIDSAPANSAGRPETAVPKATSCWPVSQHSSCAKAPCNTVLTVVWHERASSLTARVVSADSRNDVNASLPWP